jgi:hypothetical protein
MQKILGPLSEILRAGRAAWPPWTIVHFDNATPHRPVATEITFNFANSDMLPSHLTDRISVPVTSFYLAI